jgi:hypothetical protein
VFFIFACEIDNSTLKRLLSLLILAALAGLLHSFRTGASLTDGLGNGCQRAERIPERQRILVGALWSQYAANSFEQLLIIERFR